MAVRSWRSHALAAAALAASAFLATGGPVALADEHPWIDSDPSRPYCRGGDGIGFACAFRCEEGDVVRVASWTSDDAPVSVVGSCGGVAAGCDGAGTCSDDSEPVVAEGEGHCASSTNHRAPLRFVCMSGKPPREPCAIPSNPVVTCPSRDHPTADSPSPPGPTVEVVGLEMGTSAPP